ncbi:uncharacterized protein WCC33_000065 [Rhinophrynus dorsalis]
MSLHRRSPLKVEQVSKDQNQLSEHLYNSLMRNKDRNQVNEKILNLTLEIIFLLTGEEYMVVKKQNDHATDNCSPCVTEGHCRTQSTIIDHPANSLIQERDYDQKSLELTIKVLDHDNETPDLLRRNESDSDLSVADKDPPEEKIDPDTCAVLINAIPQSLLHLQSSSLRPHPSILFHSPSEFLSLTSPVGYLSSSFLTPGMYLTILPVKGIR